MESRKFIDVKKNPKEPMDQLVAELDKAELRSHYVALSEFRDHILPKSDFSWAKNHAKVKSLLKDAEDKCLILTRMMFNPDDPPRPITAIRLNRSGIRIRPNDTTRRSRFKPIKISGGLISGTVIEDRKDRV